MNYDDGGDAFGMLFFKVRRLVFQLIIASPGGSSVALQKGLLATLALTTGFRPSKGPLGLNYGSGDEGTPATSQKRQRVPERR